MIPKRPGYHRHHVIPRHAGGTDDDSNLVYLTPEEHARAHLELFKKYGKYEDAMAYNSLCKHWLGARPISGYKQSDEHIKKRTSKIDYTEVSRKLKGRPSPTKGMTFEFSDERKSNISKSLIGRSLSQESKDKIANSLRGRISPNRIEFYCIFCHKKVPPSRIDRHGIGKSACIGKNQ